MEGLIMILLNIAPTLFVGTGGQGGKIVGMLSKMASKEQKKYCVFVYLDPDINSIREIQKKYPDVICIQTSTSITVGEYLVNDSYALNNWFPVNKILYRKSPSEGAGQVRAIARLAINTSIVSNQLEPLNEAIDGLFKLTSDKNSQTIRIIITSSLGGGAGAGLILPISMYIKNYLVTKNNQNASIIRGFFLLPDIMNSVVKTEEERQNLYCNSYAALREIDAFMQKAYGTLDKKYQNLKFVVPKIGGQGFQEYNEAPFDFCFLFSRNNIENEKMTLKDDLIEHAANCIYAQAIAPTNSRQNSSEDNTILQRVKSRGRNNYCGAGAATLIYPYEDVLTYIALNLSKGAVTSEWLVIDKEYKEIVKESIRAQSQGINTNPPKRSSHYIKALETKARNDDGFAKMMIHQSNIYDETGMVVEESKWDHYFNNLNLYLDSEIDKIDDLKGIKVKIDQLMENIINGNYNKDFPADIFKETLSELMKYQEKSVEETKEKASTIAYELFDSTRKPIKSLDINNAFNLEVNLISGKGKLVHPNAIRYILYKIEHLLSDEINRTESDISNEKDKWLDFRTKIFRSESEDGRVSHDASSYITENIKMNSNTVKGKVLDLFNKSENSEARERLLNAYRVLSNSITEFIPLNIKLIVFKEALEYVKKISEAFEITYNTFDANIYEINDKIEKIYNKYDIEMHHPVRYVCANKECLDFLNEQSMYINNTFDLSGELCADIYEKVREYAILKENKEKNDYLAKAKIKDYLKNMFEDTIINYFKGTVAENCSALIDMDIIDAIEKESEILFDAYGNDAKERAVHEAIEDAKNLALPFVDAPQGMQHRIIDSCCFNDSIMTENRKSLLTKELVNFGGVASELIDKYKVIFFRSIYNLRAQDIKNFSPPIHTKTYDKPAGIYFSAYYDRINQIKYDDEDNDIITPHIHKKWHLISYLPELNPDYQYVLENEIAKAFIVGLLLGRIDYFVNGKTGKNSIYRLNFTESFLEEYHELKDLCVENNINSVHLFETFKSLVNNPKIVKALLEDYENEIDVQKRNIRQFKDTFMQRYLSDLKLKEFTNDNISILEIPLFYKYSCPSNEYFEDWSNHMIEMIFKTLKEYIGRFENEEDVTDIYTDLLLNQVNLFINDLPKIEQLGSQYTNVVHDELTTQIINATKFEFKKVGDIEKYNQVCQLEKKIYE